MKWCNNILQIQVCINHNYNNSHFKMRKFVPQYNQRILPFLGLGIHFYSYILTQIMKKWFLPLYNDKINGHIQ